MPRNDNHIFAVFNSITFSNVLLNSLNQYWIFLPNHEYRYLVKLYDKITSETRKVEMNELVLNLWEFSLLWQKLSLKNRLSSPVQVKITQNSYTSYLEWCKACRKPLKRSRMTCRYKWDVCVIFHRKICVCSQCFGPKITVIYSTSTRSGSTRGKLTNFKSLNGSFSGGHHQLNGLFDTKT